MLNSPEYSDPLKFNSQPRENSNFPDSLKVFFIGNSITTHTPLSEIGWNNTCGIAASAKEKDFCHILLRHINVCETEAYIENFAELEREDASNSERFKKIDILLQSTRPEIAVVQLGDNVSSNETLRLFIGNINRLISVAKRNCGAVYVLSTWWESKPKDAAIKSICENLGARYIYRRFI
jgi:hypothetical protein